MGEVTIWKVETSREVRLHSNGSKVTRIGQAGR